VVCDKKSVRQALIGLCLSPNRESETASHALKPKRRAGREDRHSRKRCSVEPSQIEGLTLMGISGEFCSLSLEHSA
jgi:hypothetical protein